jgi:hypothetical protein
MSTTSISSQSAVQDLARTITARLDADGDGRLSSEEFTGFLTSLLGSLQSNPLATLTGNAPGSSAVTAAARTPQGAMAGFDAGKLANLSHTSTKYQVGRVLQYYPNTPQGLKDALPELQQLFPGLSIAGNKGDQLDFGNYVAPDGTRIGVIDVLQSAGAGGTAWQWLPVD